MNELRDLYIPYEQYYCHVCYRPPYLRSGIKSHLLNCHKQDENGQPIVEKKAAKRRRSTKTATPTESPTDAVVNETGGDENLVEVEKVMGDENLVEVEKVMGDENLVEVEKVVGDEDLGGGLVYADACLWSKYTYAI